MDEIGDPKKSSGHYKVSKSVFQVGGEGLSQSPGGPAMGTPGKGTQKVTESARACSYDLMRRHGYNSFHNFNCLAVQS